MRGGRFSALTSVALRAPSVSAEGKAKPDRSCAIKTGHFNVLPTPKDATRIFSRREEQGRHRIVPSRPVRQTVFLCLFDRRKAKTHGAALEVRAAPAERAGARTGAPRDEAVPP